MGVFTADSLLDTNYISGGLDPTFNKVYYYVDNLFLGHCDSLPRDTGFVSLFENQIQKAPIRLFPNPVKDCFNLEIKNQEQYSFQLFNTLGQQYPITAEKNDTGYLFWSSLFQTFLLSLEGHVCLLYCH